MFSTMKYVANNICFQLINNKIPRLIINSIIIVGLSNKFIRVLYLFTIFSHRFYFLFIHSLFIPILYKFAFLGKQIRLNVSEHIFYYICVSLDNFCNIIKRRNSLISSMLLLLL